VTTDIWTTSTKPKYRRLRLLVCVHHRSRSECSSVCCAAFSTPLVRLRVRIADVPAVLSSLLSASNIPIPLPPALLSTRNSVVVDKPRYAFVQMQ